MTFKYFFLLIFVYMVEKHFFLDLECGEYEKPIFSNGHSHGLGEDDIGEIKSIFVNSRDRYQQKNNIVYIGKYVFEDDVPNVVIDTVLGELMCQEKVQNTIDEYHNGVRERQIIANEKFNERRQSPIKYMCKSHIFIVENNDYGLKNGQIIEISDDRLKEDDFDKKNPRILIQKNTFEDMDFYVYADNLSYLGTIEVEAMNFNDRYGSILKLINFEEELN